MAISPFRTISNIPLSKTLKQKFTDSGIASGDSAIIGSFSPASSQLFSVTPTASESFLITSVNIAMATNGNINSDTYGKVGVLTNGLVFHGQSNGIAFAIQTITTNNNYADLSNSFELINYSGVNPTGLKAIYKFDVASLEGIVLDGSQNDFIGVTARDDFLATTYFFHSYTAIGGVIL